MSLSIEDLKTMRDALVRARASGTRTVEYEGRRVTYATDPEMAAALADLERRISAMTRGSPRAIRIIGYKGIC